MDVSPASTLAGVVRFLGVVQQRKGIVIFTLFVSGVLGAFYYTTAVRMYESMAEVMVTQAGGNILRDGSRDTDVVQSLLPTYERIITGDRVLTGAIKKLPPEHRIDFEGIPQQYWRKVLRNNITISSPKGTLSIQVNTRSKSPRTAAALANALLASYHDFMSQQHLGSSRELTNLLTKDRNELQQKLSEKEAELQEMQSKWGIFSNEGGAAGISSNVSRNRLNELNKALVEAQKSTLETRSFLETLNEAVKQGDDIQQLALQELGTVAIEMFKNEIGVGTQDAYAKGLIQRELLDMKSELRNQLQNYGTRHPFILQLQQQILTMEQFLENRPQLVAQRIKQMRTNELAPMLQQMIQLKLNQAEARERQLAWQYQREEQMALAMDKRLSQIEFKSLDVKRYRSLFEALLKRITDIELGADNGLRTELLTPPQLSNTPVTPRLKMVVLLCLICGCGSGLAIVWVIDALDDRFRSPDELKNQLGVPVLAMIQQLRATGGVGIDAVQTLANPHGIESEAFRTLRTQIGFSAETTQRIMTTSTEPGDGKTTVISNLAVAYAQSGKRTLVIDADMRRPGLTALFDLRGTKGLSQVLRDTQPIGESCLANLCASGAAGMDVLPSGPRPANPAELLVAGRFAELLEWASSVYDQILIDAPPALAVSDAAIIARMADGVLLVVRPDKNQRKLVIRAAETFTAIGGNLLGTVINNVSKGGSGEYQGYGYGYGYGHDDQDTETHGELTHVSASQNPELGTTVDENGTRTDNRRAA